MFVSSLCAVYKFHSSLSLALLSLGIKTTPLLTLRKTKTRRLSTNYQDSDCVKIKRNQFTFYLQLNELELFEKQKKLNEIRVN